MSDPVESYLNGLKPILTAVNEILDSWDGQGCYQIPTLIGNLSVQLNWDADQARRNDPIVRSYLRDHPVWYVTRGAHGGIMKRSEYQKKEAAKEAKARAKEDILLALANRAAQQTSVPASVSVTPESDNTNTVSE